MLVWNGQFLLLPIRVPIIIVHTLLIGKTSLISDVPSGTKE